MSCTLVGYLQCGNTLSARLTAPCRLVGTLTAPGTLKATMTIPCSIVSDIYTGEYTVTPKARSEVVLATNGKLMEDDVTVLKVPYFETSNKYGETVYIANEV